VAGGWKRRSAKRPGLFLFFLYVCRHFLYTIFTSPTLIMFPYLKSTGGGTIRQGQRRPKTGPMTVLRKRVGGYLIVLILNYVLLNIIAASEITLSSFG